MKGYDFKIPVFKQINIGSPVLMIGQRVGKIYPIAHRVEDSFLVQKQVDKRLETALTDSKRLRFPGGTITKLPENNDPSKKVYTVSFVTEVDDKIICPLCRDDCKNTKKNIKRKSNNKVFVDSQQLSLIHI